MYQEKHNRVDSRRSGVATGVLAVGGAVVMLSLAAVIVGKGGEEREGAEETVDKEKEDAGATIDELERERMGIKTKIEGLKTEYSGIEAEIKSRKQEMEEIETEIEGLKTEYSGIEAEIESRKQEMEEIEAIVKRLRTEWAEIQDGIENHKQEREEIQETIEKRVRAVKNEYEHEKQKKEMDDIELFEKIKESVTQAVDRYFVLQDRCLVLSENCRSYKEMCSEKNIDTKKVDLILQTCDKIKDQIRTRVRAASRGFISRENLKYENVLSLWESVLETWFKKTEPKLDKMEETVKEFKEQFEMENKTTDHSQNIEEV
jgi:chromosome segregation ATPase